MSLITWLSLYLAGLVELAIRYRLSFDRGGAIYIVLIPVVAVAVLRPPRNGSNRVSLICPLLGGLLALCCTILFARQLSLDFWDTQRLDLAWMSAGVGVGGLFAVREESPRAAWQFANWIIISVGWLLALSDPLAPWLALAPAASLAIWQRAESSPSTVDGLSPAWLLFWIGMALPISWWDSDAWGAVGTALWALAAAVTYLPKLRDLRPPFALTAIALLSIAYAWLPIWIWAPLLGALSGWALQHTGRPWHWAASYALLAGLLVSYGMHSNLQWFGWLVWGAR